MTDPLEKLKASPLLARVTPFAVFLALTYGQGQFGEASKYWFYLAKTLVGAWLLWSWRGALPEMRWAFSVEAVVVGVGIFALWVGLDGLYPSVDQIIQKFICPLLRGVGLESWCPKPATESPPWNPFTQFGASSALGCFSFVYRYIVRQDFEAMPLGHFIWKPFLITSFIFGAAHFEWLPGILCGLAYQWLVCRKGRLGDAMLAHGITNFLLALWVVGKGAWHFW
jgi:uncharacterized protein